MIFFASRAKRPSSRMAGFTLLEVTIVLSIVGIVIAAVWGAGAMASYRVKINRASDELNTITGNMFAFYASQNVSYSALNAAKALNIIPLSVTSGATTDFCYYTPKLQGLNLSGHPNVFPAEMLTTAGLANHPWSQMTACTGAIGTAQVSLACSTNGGICVSSQPTLFAVRYTAVQSPSTQAIGNVCTQLLLRNSVPGFDTRLKDIVVTWSGGSQVQTIYSDVGTTSPCLAGNLLSSACVLPISTSDANTACNAIGNNTTLTIDWYYQLGG